MVEKRKEAAAKALEVMTTAPTPRGADRRFESLAMARGHYDEWIAALEEYCKQYDGHKLDWAPP